MKSIVFFLALNMFTVALSAQVDATKTDSVTASSSVTPDSAFSVMSGIFTVGENDEIPQEGKITVVEDITEKVVGIFRPNKKTGKYLFILQAGKTYNIKFEAEGSIFRSESLIVPTSTSYKKIYKKINLGKL